MTEFFHNVTQIATDPSSFFDFFGYMGLACILFAETGLFGFFLPGDSLLITLGLMSAEGDLDIKILIPTLILATVLGDHFSYFLGVKFNKWVRENIHRFFLESRHIEKAETFYEQHGGKTILFCKFIPFIRTFAPFVAATTRMDFFRFSLFDIIGATLWITSIVGLSHYVSETFEINIKGYFHYLVFFLIFVIFSPLLLKFIQKKQKITS